jgi:hypothetical protein
LEKFVGPAETELGVLTVEVRDEPPGVGIEANPRYPIIAATAIPANT